MGRLNGKRAIITGAASGIGRATAELFRREGAVLTLTDINDAALTAVAAACSAELALRHDVTSEADWQAVFRKTLAQAERVDILVNSAGIAVRKSIEDTTLDDWRRINAVNGAGTFLGCREAVRAMKSTGGGSIVNLSSAAGLIGDPSMAAYCASKGAVRLLTKSVALHCARKNYGIRCNSVHPSYTSTPMVDALVGEASSPERVRAGLERASPIGRMGTPEDIANLILFLATDESAFITGAEMAIDGGLTAA
jgi:3(or 17)beta-hydroxysteroid dehydrogenase